MVEVHLFAAARAAVGTSMVTVDAGTLADVLDRLSAAAPDFDRVRPQCSYLIDGVAVHDDPSRVDLAPGMRLDVLPPFAGG
jgi:molybdopterin converting factor small subunit